MSAHVVAHHATEPPNLIALVGQVVADVGRRGDADLIVLGALVRGKHCLVRGSDGPFNDEGVSQLHDEAVGLATREFEGLGSVGRHPHVELAALHPGNLDGAVVNPPSHGPRRDPSLPSCTPTVSPVKPALPR